jgi:predicted esterase
MKLWLFVFLLAVKPLYAGDIFAEVPANADPGKIYLIYLHGRIIENAGPRPTHPDFGLYDYPAVLEALASRGAVVISQQRPPKTDMDSYAAVVLAQIAQLIEQGVSAENIVVVGFSKGGGIASRVSALSTRPQLRYVLLAACPNRPAPAMLQLSGHILSLTEQSDTLAASCQALASPHKLLQSFYEIQIATGKRHGAFYQPLPQWLDPVLDWVHRPF